MKKKLIRPEINNRNQLSVPGHQGRACTGFFIASGGQS
jgi:hypothetical protein